MPNNMESMQERFQKELDIFNTIQKDIQKCLQTREKLDAQLTENTLVKDEMALIEGGSSVFKLIGPVLVKQDIVEAKSNVQKRIDYITAELKRQEDTMTESEKKQESQKEKIQKIQHQFQQAQVKAAASQSS